MDQVNAIVAGGLWDRAAIFITWDDWGGLFDHVDPPVKEPWNSAHAERLVLHQPRQLTIWVAHES